MPSAHDLRKKARQARRAASVETSDHIVDRELLILAEQYEREASDLEKHEVKEKAETS